MSEELELLELLVPDMEGWAVYRSSEKGMQCPNRTVPFVYGEHVEGCSRPFNRKTAGLNWEWWDAEPGKKDKCWQCDDPVPEGVVAIVALMNWKEIAGGDSNT